MIRPVNPDDSYFGGVTPPPYPLKFRPWISVEIKAWQKKACFAESAVKLFRTEDPFCCQYKSVSCPIRKPNGFTLYRDVEDPVIPPTVYKL
jgi:hypothetical protein